MSCVHYKFKSSLDYDTVTFDGLHISVADLKKAILQQKKIGKSSDFDLQITNAQTKEEYKDESSLISKNSSVIVARVPLINTKIKPWERCDSPSGSSKAIEDEPATIPFEKLSKTADLASANAPEEDKIRAMMAQSSQDYDPVNYVRNKYMPGPPPPNYLCHRCQKPGHWIKMCLTNSYEKNIKRSTGIPRSFMVAVDGPGHKGVMMTSNGQYAIPIIDREAYKEGKKERPPFSKEKSPEKIPEVRDIPAELLCLLCRNLLQDAVLIPCCGNSYCDECIRATLLDTEEHECPTCHETEISPDTLICNKFLRQAVNNYTNNTYARFTSQPKATVKIEEPKPVVTSTTSTPEQRPGTPVKDEKHAEGGNSPHLTAEQNLTPPKSKDGSNRDSTKHVSEKVGQAVPVLGQKPEVRNTRMPPSTHISAVIGLPLRMRKDALQRHSQKSHYHRNSERVRNSGMEENISVSSPAIHHSAYIPPQSAHVIAPPHLPQLYQPAQHLRMPQLVGMGPPHPVYRLAPPPGMNLPPGMPLPPPPQPPPPGLGPPIRQMQPLHPPGSYPFPGIAPVPPPLSEEEFYREQRRLKEEEKKSDPLDDFARELLEYKREQRRRCSHHCSSRSYSRSRSRSRSFSRSRTRSRSKYSSRYSRSRSRSRSHSRRHTSPLTYRHKSRSPYKRGRSPPRRDYSPGYHQGSPAYRYPNPPHPPMPHHPLPPPPPLPIQYSDDRAPHYYYQPYPQYDNSYRYNEVREPRFDANFAYAHYEESYRDHNKRRRSFSPPRDSKKTRSRSPLKSKSSPYLKDKHYDAVEEKHKKKHKKRPKKEIKDSKENKNISDVGEDIKEGKEKERKERRSKKIPVDIVIERKKEHSKSKISYEMSPEVRKERVLIENIKNEEEQLAELEYKREIKLKEKRKRKLKEAALLQRLHSEKIGKNISGIKIQKGKHLGVEKIDSEGYKVARSKKKHSKCKVVEYESTSSASATSPGKQMSDNKKATKKVKSFLSKARNRKLEVKEIENNKDLKVELVPEEQVMSEEKLLEPPNDVENANFSEEKEVDNIEESEDKTSVKVETEDEVFAAKELPSQEPDQNEVEEREEGAVTDSSEADDDQVLKVHMPELSKWEREELEEDSKPISPVRKKILSNKPSVPTAIIQKADTVLRSKVPKSAITAPTLDSTSTKLNERRVFTSDMGPWIQFNQEGRSSTRDKGTERKDSEALQVTISTSFRDKRSIEKWEMDTDKYHNQEKVRSPDITGKLIKKKGLEKHEKLPRDSERLPSRGSRDRSPKLREEFTKAERNHDYEKMRKSKALAKFDRERELHHATKYSRSERILKEGEVKNERKIERKDSKEKRSREKTYDENNEKSYGKKVSIRRPITTGDFKDREERKPVEESSKRKEEKKVTSENYEKKDKKEMYMSKTVHKIDFKENKIADHKELSHDESTFEPDYNVSDSDGEGSSTNENPIKQVVEESKSNQEDAPDTSRTLLHNLHY